MQLLGQPQNNNVSSKITRAVGIAWMCTLTAVLLSYAYLGSFSRYISDDFQTAAYVRSKGFWQSQQYWYQQWTGRFSFIFTINLIQKYLGPQVVPFFPMIAISLWVLALTWVIFEFSSLFKWNRSVATSVLLAELIVVVVLAINGSTADIIYWETGIVTYTLPIIMILSIFGGLAFWAQSDKRSSPVLVILTGVATAFMGGFSETFATFQTTLFGIALFSSSFKICIPAQRVRRFMTAAFVGSLVAMCIVASSPGNQIRIDALKPVRYDLVWVFKSAFLYAFYLIYRFLFLSPLAAAMAFMLPAALAFQISPPAGNHSCREGAELYRSLKLLLLNFVVLILMAACTVPAFYAMSACGPARALLLPQLLMVMAVCGWGYLIGASLKTIFATSRVAGAISILILTSLLVIEPTKMIRTNSQSLPIARRYAQEWDLQDQEIRKSKASGLNEVNVHVGHDGVNASCRLTTNSQDWYNQAVADYYGLKSIVAPDSTQKSCD